MQVAGRSNAKRALRKMGRISAYRRSDEFFGTILVEQHLDEDADVDHADASFATKTKRSRVKVHGDD